MSGPPDLAVRPYRADDLALLHRLMHETIHTVSLHDYTPAQVAAWAPDPQSPPGAAQRARLAASLDASIACVADWAGKPVGFGNVTPAGFMDYLYVHREYQGRGVASRLLTCLEAAARGAGARRMDTYASLTLRPLLERRGYQVLERRRVMVAGVAMENFWMVKGLSPGT
ncbi:MAG: GNAT family N-acetyltransferase [Clostridia bacterium]